jgi:hypothetical protein
MAAASDVLSLLPRIPPPINYAETAFAPVGMEQTSPVPITQSKAARAAVLLPNAAAPGAQLQILLSQTTAGCGIAAEHREAMAGVQQLLRRLKTDTGAAICEQNVPLRVGGVAVPSLVLTVSSHGVRLFPKARRGRDSILLVTSSSGGRATSPCPRQLSADGLSAFGISGGCH